MIPPKTDPRWSKLVRGEVNTDFKNLAVKLLVSKLKVANLYSKSELTLEKTIGEAYDYFSKNLDAAKDDINSIFGQSLR